MFKPDKNDFTGCIDILRALNCLPRWSAHTGHLQDNFTEVAKLGFNCQIAYPLAALVKHEQQLQRNFTEFPEIRFEYFPRIAIYRAFEKYEKCDIMDETYQRLFSGHEQLEKDFDNYMKEKIISSTSHELFEHISGLENTLEMKIFKAATALATYIESYEIKKYVDDKAFSEIQKRLMIRLENYKIFPIIRNLLTSDSSNEEYEYEKIMSLFSNFSSLRNRIRWVKRAPIINYTVLGHCFDVAIYNYLISLNDTPNDVEKASKGFFVGIYHDLAEIWTGDMPSPLKDAISGLRKRTEELEVEVLEENVFPNLPQWFVPQFKTIMLELLPETEHKYYKIGDDLAAAIEASTQLAVGSSDKYFSNAFLRTLIVTSSHSKTLKQVFTILRKNIHLSNLKVLHFKLKTKRAT